MTRLHYTYPFVYSLFIGLQECVNSNRWIITHLYSILLARSCSHPLVIYLDQLFPSSPFPLFKQLSTLAASPSLHSFPPIAWVFVVASGYPRIKITSLLSLLFYEINYVKKNNFSKLLSLYSPETNAQCYIIILRLCIPVIIKNIFFKLSG